MEVRRGDIIMIRLYGHGNIQDGLRPAIIVQNNLGNKFSPTTIVVPLTTKIKQTTQPTHEVIKREDTSGLKENSMALCEQIMTVNKADITKKICMITNKEIMNKISRACAVSLAIG